jgi:hypothetical protein
MKTRYFLNRVLAEEIAVSRWENEGGSVLTARGESERVSKVHTRAVPAIVKGAMSHVCLTHRSGPAARLVARR